MPCLQVRTNIKLSQEQKAVLLSKLSKAVNKVTGKPEAYIMVILQDEVPMLFGGQDTPCVFMDFRSIGCISRSNNKKSSKEFTSVFAEYNIPPERVYISFANMNAEDWGYNGDTFA